MIVVLAAIVTLVLGLAALVAGTWKILRVAFRVDAALPTLLGIADEFSPNGGNSLRDVVNRVESEQTRVRIALIEHTTQDEVRFAQLHRVLKDGTGGAI